MIGTTIGHGKLKIISELGRGGMGVLYLAEHVHLGKRFAVKSLSPELTQDSKFRERFFQEAREQALLSHPNIVQAIDFFEEGGQFFFVMEYAEGRDLESLIKSRDRLPEHETLRIFAGVLEGLKFAHGKGIIHRDIKPSNILIGEDGGPRITDFGIAILVGGERLTATGTVIGSPWYMSPEQILHPKNIDHRSDIYSAGIALFEMLTGDVPFDGETDFIVKDLQINSPPPDPRQRNPQISPRLAEMVLKAMAKSPDARFQDCSEFLESLEAYMKKRDNRITALFEPVAASADGSAPSWSEKRTNTHVFISYLRENRNLVDKLCEELRHGGIDVCLDRDRILPGKIWQDAIRMAI